MTWWFISISIDLITATVITCAFSVFLCSITFAGALLLQHRHQSASLAARTREVPATQPETSSAVLFVLKGQLMFLLLMQGSEHIGPVASCWICSFVLEFAGQRKDTSINVLLEPPLQPIDYAFLLIVAPALSVPAGGAHGSAAAWLVYLSVCFFWRSSATSVLVPSAFSAAGANSNHVLSLCVSCLPMAVTVA